MTEEQPLSERERSRELARIRMEQQQTWVDLQVRQAMERGDFDNLPGAGKPLPDLGREHDPDWWVKQLIEREKITGVVPESVQLRKDDAELDAQLDLLHREGAVRAEIEGFNARVIAARYRLPEGPPLVTMPRDVEETVAAWRERRTTKSVRQAEPERPRRRWFRHS